MLVFYIEIIVVYILSLYARLSEDRNKLLKKIFIVAAIIVLFLVSGLRNGIGDTGMYNYLYSLVGPDYDSKGGYEPGFILFFKLLKLISAEPQFMLLVTSLIVSVANIWILRGYPGYFELNTFLYITSGYYIVTMNGIRQSLAAAVLFACSNFIIKGKFKFYTAVVILMYTFHSSTLVLIPVYFLVRSEAWSRKVYIFIFLFLIGLILYDPLMNAVFGALGDTKFAEYKNFKEGGANLIRVAVYAVPVILAYIKKDKVKEHWAESNVFVNMSVLNLIIMCFALNNWIFARFTIYFQMYNFVLLSYIIKFCTRKTERRILYFGLLVAYLAFFWYEQSITLQMKYTTDINILN